MTPDLIPFVIPSPDEGVWYLGPVPVRAYALCILAGVFAGIWLTNRRFVARGGLPGTASDIAVWAVPFGLVGARLYHVISDYQLYFGPGQRPIEALYIWQGGLGIWGSVSMGALGAYIGCRRNGISFSAFADAIAPGLALGQAIGRWGNWFNQELFGKPTELPWALEIDVENRPPGYEQFDSFHPTFLYEFFWNLGVVGLLLWADRRFKLGFGRVFWLYVMAYTAGRGWIEYLRIDTVNEVMGLRLNVWTSIIVFLLALAFFVRTTRRRRGREAVVDRRAEAARDEAHSTGTAEESAESSSGDASDVVADADTGRRTNAAQRTDTDRRADAKPDPPPDPH